MIVPSRPAPPSGGRAEAPARRLAAGAPVTAEDGLGQSLASGAAGTALLHIERAHAGIASWQTAHRWVQAATAGQISAADHAGLYFGAPAISFVLHAAAAGGTGRYRAALAGLDAHVAALTHRRVSLTRARIDLGDVAAFAEYDLISGLTGIGAHLLRHDPGSDALREVLAYLVRLTKPARRDGHPRPGWWTFHDPRVGNSPDFPGGHANNGLVHGIAGPLALLAQAQRRRITVDGQIEAIAGICAWLDTWRQGDDSGPWWPQWITAADLRAGHPSQLGRGRRPSWCYGTPGIARAQQLAGIATGDAQRQQTAEQALARCVSDPAQLSRLRDAGLCHGWAGLYQTVYRAARDAITPALRSALPPLTDMFSQHALLGEGQDMRLLEGRTGVALALHTAAHSGPPVSGWDACLLIN